MKSRIIPEKETSEKRHNVIENKERFQGETRIINKKVQESRIECDKEVVQESRVESNNKEGVQEARVEGNDKEKVQEEKGECNNETNNLFQANDLSGARVRDKSDKQKNEHLDKNKIVTNNLEKRTSRRIRRPPRRLIDECC